MSDTGQSTVVTLALDSGSDGVCGWLCDGSSSTDFDGWLELFSLLRTIAAGADLADWQVRARPAAKRPGGDQGG